MIGNLSTTVQGTLRKKHRIRQDRKKNSFHGPAYPKISQQSITATHRSSARTARRSSWVFHVFDAAVRTGRVIY